MARRRVSLEKPCSSHVVVVGHRLVLRGDHRLRNVGIGDRIGEPKDRREEGARATFGRLIWPTTVDISRRRAAASRAIRFSSTRVATGCLASGGSRSVLRRFRDCRDASVPSRQFSSIIIAILNRSPQCQGPPASRTTHCHRVPGYRRRLCPTGRPRDALSSLTINWNHLPATWSAFSCPTTLDESDPREQSPARLTPGVAN